MTSRRHFNWLSTEHLLAAISVLSMATLVLLPRLTLTSRGVRLCRLLRSKLCSIPQPRWTNCSRVYCSRFVCPSLCAPNALSRSSTPTAVPFVASRVALRPLMSTSVPTVPILALFSMCFTLVPPLTSRRACAGASASSTDRAKPLVRRPPRLQARCQMSSPLQRRRRALPRQQRSRTVSVLRADNRRDRRRDIERRCLVSLRHQQQRQRRRRRRRRQRHIMHSACQFRRRLLASQSRR